MVTADPPRPRQSAPAASLPPRRGPANSSGIAKDSMRRLSGKDTNMEAPAKNDCSASSRLDKYIMSFEEKHGALSSVATKAKARRKVLAEISNTVSDILEGKLEASGNPLDNSIGNESTEDTAPPVVVKRRRKKVWEPKRLEDVDDPLDRLECRIAALTKTREQNERLKKRNDSDHSVSSSPVGDHEEPRGRKARYKVNCSHDKSMESASVRAGSSTTRKNNRFPWNHDDIEDIETIVARSRSRSRPDATDNIADISNIEVQHDVCDGDADDSDVATLGDLTFPEESTPGANKDTDLSGTEDEPLPTSEGLQDDHTTIEPDTVRNSVNSTTPGLDQDQQMPKSTREEDLKPIVASPELAEPQAEGTGLDRNSSVHDGSKIIEPEAQKPACPPPSPLAAKKKTMSFERTPHDDNSMEAIQALLNKVMSMMGEGGQALETEADPWYATQQEDRLVTTPKKAPRYPKPTVEDSGPIMEANSVTCMNMQQQAPDSNEGIFGRLLSTLHTPGKTKIKQLNKDNQSGLHVVLDYTGRKVVPAHKIESSIPPSPRIRKMSPSLSPPAADDVKHASSFRLEASMGTPRNSSPDMSLHVSTPGSVNLNLTSALEAAESPAYATLAPELSQHMQIVAKRKETRAQSAPRTGRRHNMVDSTPAPAPLPRLSSGLPASVIGAPQQEHAQHQPVQRDASLQTSAVLSGPEVLADIPLSAPITEGPQSSCAAAAALPVMKPLAPVARKSMRGTGGADAVQSVVRDDQKSPVTQSLSQHSIHSSERMPSVARESKVDISRDSSISSRSTSADLMSRRRSTGGLVRTEGSFVSIMKHSMAIRNLLTSPIDLESTTEYSGSRSIRDTGDLDHILVPSHRMTVGYLLNSSGESMPSAPGMKGGLENQQLDIKYLLNSSLSQSSLRSRPEVEGDLGQVHTQKTSADKMNVQYFLNSSGDRSLTSEVSCQSVGSWTTLPSSQLRQRPKH